MITIAQNSNIRHQMKKKQTNMNKTPNTFRNNYETEDTTTTTTKNDVEEINYQDDEI